MKKIFLLSVLVISYSLKSTAILGADTIYTNDNKEIKGIIIEEYKDRVLMSTVDGERTIMKPDIKELYFDTEEQNLVKLAEQARDRSDFMKAFAYYDKAFKVNPESKAAKDGFIFLEGYLFRKDMAGKERDVNRRNEFESMGPGPITIKAEEEKFREDLEKLKITSGITLKSDRGVTQIDSVIIGSPAYEAGVRKGDILIAIWGRFVGYLSVQEVVQTLLEKTSLETKCTIERTVELASGDSEGIFKMQFDGLTVSDIKGGSLAQEAGLKPNDVITGINGQSTRYTPIKKALELIKKSKDGIVKLTFRREIVIWGKEGR